MKKHYKVLITTSGIGARLGDITKYTNKALIALGDKPIISYIIDLYPPDTEFVITLGYMESQVRDFLEMVYPKKHFTFVSIQKYQGLGTSLGYSMLKAEKHLQCPFIFHASDTIVKEKPPQPHANWVGGYKGEGSSLYRSFNSIDHKVQKMNEKGAVNPDYLHIGLIGIHDYAEFWKSLRTLYKKTPAETTLSDAHVIDDMIMRQYSFEVVPFHQWFDTGNVEGLQLARKNFSNKYTTLEKLEEAIYFFDTSIVKYFYDKSIAEERVKRATLLESLVPQILQSKHQFYQYKKIQGNLYATSVTPKSFPHFLDWSQKNLWKEHEQVTATQFKKVCFDFYYNKTIKRITSFLETRSIVDKKIRINGELVPDIKTVLSQIDFDELSTAKQYQFHGDFILDNVIEKGDRFYLLDWRQNFGGLLESGDMYYDLAKLNHNLIVNHQIVNDNLFTITVQNNSVTCDILRKDAHVQCQKLFEEFVIKNNYDLHRIKLLTGLIWLNMSPLHHHPFDLFLYYYGTLYLWRTIHEKN